jgi:hypothetical protein
VVGADGCRLNTINSETADRITITHDDAYRAACELAQVVGIDLEG